MPMFISRIVPRIILPLLVLTILGFAGQGTARATTWPPRFYVALDGNDAWTGTHPAPNAKKTDGPFATLPRAVAAVRQLRAANPRHDGPTIVQVRGGTYFLEETLALAPEDSGESAQAPVIYEATPGERVVLSGGTRITGWRVGEDGRWRANLDVPGKPAWRFAQLWVNDERRFRPRLPKQGYFRIERRVDPPSPATASAPATAPAAPIPPGRLPGSDRFGFAPGQIRGDWRNLRDVEILAMQVWSMARLRVKEVDAADRVVTLTGRVQSAMSHYAMSVGRRFIVENVAEALSEPGEWHLDNATGELTYIPKPGETPENTVVVAPRLRSLLQLHGDPAGRECVRFVHFSRLEFAHANWMLTDKGRIDGQAESSLGAAIEAVGARDCQLQLCTVRNVGEYAISFGKGCRNDVVSSCELFDLGGGGVKIGGGPPAMRVPSSAPASSAPAPATRPAAPAILRDASTVSPEEILDPAVDHITVSNCVIAHGGRLHPAAVGVWIEHSPHNTVEHNDIFDFYYTGVSVGWVWGYRPSAAHHNVVADNHIHTIGQGVLSDMGGIYTLGVSPGTRLERNVIHDVVSFSYGGWGLYTDEGSSFITMRDNLVYRTKTGGFHQHYGQENVLENNIFALASQQQLQRSREEEHLSFTFRRNLVYWSKGELLGSTWRNGRFAFDHNIYWRTDGKPVTFAGDTFEAWQAKGRDADSRVADPLFVAPDRGDFHLRPGSPAEEVGFKPFDYGKAGWTRPPVMAEVPSVPRAFPVLPLP
ncbi:MAG: right-handed parallel beta-helix repeat-containing protein [Planctomycetota bacterium]|nr:right-handed parallel beta-helix repeat-containing protein [Planctomycetota bacterium]